MPRGNDSAAVRAENVGRFGDYASAEDLIRHQAALVDPALQKVLNTPLNEDATVDAQGRIKELGSRFDLAEGEELVDVAVRGNALVGVIEQADGRRRKALTGWDDDWEPPALTDEEKRRTEAARAVREADEQIARIRSAADEEIRKAEEAAAAEIAEKKAAIRKATEDALADADAAIAEADTAAAAAAEQKAAKAAREAAPATAPDVSKMKGDDLDELAEREGVEGYKKSATVAERRKALKKHLAGK